MSPTYEYPGVYIEEQPAPGAIQPVATNNAAFLGRCEGGTPNLPQLVTSFDQFKDQFGADPVDGSSMWYAVKGYFENGGSKAYIVRVSGGAAAELRLLDQNNVEVLVVRAVDIGVPASPISVVISNDSMVNTELFRPSFNPLSASDTSIQMDNDPVTGYPKSVSFRVEDRVSISEGGNTEVVTVTAVSTQELTLGSKLTNSYTAAADLRLADIGTGGEDEWFRVQSSGGDLAKGSVITLDDSTNSETIEVKSVLEERLAGTEKTFRVQIKGTLANSFSADPADTATQIDSMEFNLIVSQGSSSKQWSLLSPSSYHPNYVINSVAMDPSSLVTISLPEIINTSNLVDRFPQDPTAAPDLQGGASDTLPSNSDWENAIVSMREVDAINFIAMPDTQDVIPQGKLISHCELMKDRFAILDATLSPKPADSSLTDHIEALRSTNGYAAFYYPWITVPNASGNGLTTIPPSGHVAGIYALADSTRGVHKAPANFTLNGAQGVVAHGQMDNAMQGVLNMKGVNVLRIFPGNSRPTVWGARTTSGETTYKYINIRRLLLYIEESIAEGIRWAVFEPNDPKLWKSLKRVIDDFLEGVTRDGGLFRSEDSAPYYVRIDEALNPLTERSLGRLYIEIGVNPVYPAEFIIVRIGLWDGGAEVTES